MNVAGQTGRVRIYLPSTLDELDTTATRSGGSGNAVASFEPRIVHAVTPALREALPDEDEEGLEFLALLAAADEALLRIGARPDAPRLRLVLSLDVPEADLKAIDDDDDQAPSAIRLLVAHWYENRGLIAPGATVTPLPSGVADLISPYRVRSL